MKKTKTRAKIKSDAPTQLRKIRQKISKIDRQIAKLCSARLKLTGQVFTLKRREKMKLIDSQREQAVLLEYLQVLGAETSTARIKSLVQSVIELSPTYPKSKLFF